MNYKTKNWKEDTEELYFGLKTAFNCFDMSSTYNQLIDKLWDIFEAAEYPVHFIQNENELKYCFKEGIISAERIEKEKKPVIILLNNETLYAMIEAENVPCLYSTITPKLGKETRKVTRYILENQTLEKTFEVQPELVKAILREKSIETVIKD